LARRGFEKHLKHGSNQTADGFSRWHARLLVASKKAAKRVIATIAPPKAIEGYVSSSSVASGDVLTLHVRALRSDPYFKVQFVRLGIEETTVAAIDAIQTSFVPTGRRDDALLAAQGCDWPAAFTTIVPASWKSGVYYARLSGYRDRQMPSGHSCALVFVVRAAEPGSTSSILVHVSDSTYQAYNAWGGVSSYTSPLGPRCSYSRPYINLVKQVNPWILKFVRYLEAQGITAEFCSSHDLDVRSSLVRNYALFLSVGHDEYWTKAMLDSVEGFIARGGNACFFSGDVAVWQMRFEDNGRTFVCYKDAAADPIDDPSLKTTHWFRLGRPSNAMVGAGYQYGAGWWSNFPTLRRPERRRGYKVQFADHWVYERTRLADGATFGAGSNAETTIIGYETDAAAYEIIDGVAVPTGVDGTPKDEVILGYCDLSDWSYTNGRPGYATMGIYERGRSVPGAGTVFTAGTINWVGQLTPKFAGGPVDVITQNLIYALSRETAAPEAQQRLRTASGQ